jgi:uncharacterized membrane protein
MERNLILYAATYDNSGLAAADYEALKAAESLDLQVVAALIMDRDAEGKVTVREKAGIVSGGAVLGGAAGLVLGLFAPPLLAATAVGAGIGAVVGGLVKKHQEKELGLELEEVLPVNSSAIIAIVNDVYADRVDKALSKATKHVSKAIDSGDYEKLAKALAEGDAEIIKALNS